MNKVMKMIVALRSFSYFVSLWIVGLLSVSHIAYCDSPASKSQNPYVDPRGVALLRGMETSFKSLRTLSGTEVSTSAAFPQFNNRLWFVCAATGQFRITEYTRSGTFYLYSDGKNLVVADPSNHASYYQAQMPDLGLVTMRAGIGLPLFLQQLIYGDAIINNLLRTPSVTISVTPISSVDGVPVVGVMAQYIGNGHPIMEKFLIGRDDHLLHGLLVSGAGKGSIDTRQMLRNLHLNAHGSADNTAFVPPAGAQPVTAEFEAPDDTKALRQLSQIASLYSGLQSFSCHSTFVTTYPRVSLNGKLLPCTRRAALTYALQRPQSIRFRRTLETGSTLAVSNGTNLFVTTSEGGALQDHYLNLPLKTDFPNNSFLLETFGGLPAPVQFASSWMPALLFGHSPLTGEYSSLTTSDHPGLNVRYGKSMSVGGEPVDLIEIRNKVFAWPGIPSETKTTLFVRQKDGLLSRVTDSTPYRGVACGSSETYSDIQANVVLPKSVFTFTPPPGSSPVDTPAKLSSTPRLTSLQTGAFPPLIDAVDTSGNKATWDQYRGKVVLLDFWQVSCPPCVAQIPYLSAVYRRYHSQGFDILGITAAPRNDEHQLQVFTEAHQMPWRQINDPVWRLLGECKASMIPLSVLIGKDGKIAAIDLRGKQIEVDVKAALAKDRAVK